MRLCVQLYGRSTNNLIARACLILLFIILSPLKGHCWDGYFWIQSAAQDIDGDHAFLVLDVRDANGNIDGLVHLSPLNSESPDSQKWKQFVGVNEAVYQNKLTAKCLAFGDTVATINDCNADPNNVNWLIENSLGSPGAYMLSMRRAGQLYRLHKQSTAKFATLSAFGDDQFTSIEEDWNVTVAPIGTVQQAVGGGALPTPPTRPSGCSVFGTANCGLVGFNCNPLSAADTIVVATRSNIGVSVINVEPKLGLINGKYQNEGQTSVAICAVKAGMHACSDPLNVTFGPTLCAWGPPSFCPGSCPQGQIKCGCECKSPANCSHLP